MRRSSVKGKSNCMFPISVELMIRQRLTSKMVVRPEISKMAKNMTYSSFS